MPVVSFLRSTGGTVEGKNYSCSVYSTDKTAMPHAIRENLFTCCQRHDKLTSPAIFWCMSVGWCLCRLGQINDGEEQRNSNTFDKGSCAEWLCQSFHTWTSQPAQLNSSWVHWSERMELFNDCRRALSSASWCDISAVLYKLFGWILML